MEQYFVFTTLQISESGFHVDPFNGLNQNCFKAYFQLFQPCLRGKSLLFSQPNNEKS